MRVADRPPSRWRTAAVLALLWLPPTAVLAVAQGGLRVDVENRGLKSVDTDQAAALERIRRAFGADHDLLLGFFAPPGMELVPADRHGLVELAHRLRGIPGVVGVQGPLPGDQGLELMAVALGDGAAETRTAAADAVVDAARRSCPPTLSVRAAGLPLTEVWLSRSMDAEQRSVVPAVVGVLALLLMVLYRSPLLTAAVLAPAGLAILWVRGGLALLGYRLDPVAALLQPVLLTVGVAMSIHVVEAYLYGDADAGPRRVAAAARRELWVPTVLATATTMVGFLSPLTSPIPAVGTFGVFAALGAALCAWISFWSLPSFLAAFVPVRGRRPRSPQLTHYVGWLSLRRGGVMAAAAVAGLGLLIAGSGLQVDNDPLGILPPGDALRRDTEVLADRLGGVETFGLLVPAESAATDPEVLALLASELETDPAVSRLGGPPERDAGGDVLLRAVLTRSGSALRERLFDRVDAVAADLGFDGVRVAGPAVQIARDSAELVRAQLSSVMITLPLLALAIAVGLRSVRLGLISLIPNGMPWLMIHGLMVAVGSSLSVATAMIGAAMMGLIVDDTIHLLHRYRERRRRGGSRRSAVRAALVRTARPITITSVVLVLGFAVGAFGRLTSTIEFSLLASVTIAVAWLLDVLVLPAMLLGVRRRRLRRWIPAAVL